MTKPAAPGKKKTFVPGRLLAKFRMAAAKPSGPKRKRRYVPKPRRPTRPRPKPSGNRRRKRLPRPKR